MAVTEKTIAESAPRCRRSSKATIEATRLIYTDKAKVLPAIIKYTAAAEGRGREGLDYMIKCIDADSGLGAPRQLYRRADGKGRQRRAGEVPKCEELVDLSFPDNAIKEISESTGPICRSE